MKTFRTHSKASLFLMELILAVFFFALASTVCFRLFARAYSLEKQSTSLSQGVGIAQNLAESFLGCDGDLAALQALFEGSSLSADGRTLTLEEAGYSTTLTLTPDSSKEWAEAEIQVLAPISHASIYTLRVTHHTPAIAAPKKETP